MASQQHAKQPLSHTLWSPIDTVKDVADSLGMSELNDETSRNLAMDVEYRIHEILEQATKFMRHSKRRTLSTTDIEKALKVLNVEPLYGYDVSRPLQFKEALVGNGQTLYYIDDEEVDFEKLVNQPLPKVPRATTFTAHWLAIEGVQPAIPQNPLESEIRQLPPAQRGALSHQLTENSVASSNSHISNGNTTALNKDAEVKPLVKHVLSKELQLYFNKVIQALTNQNADDEALHLRQAALSSLRSDPGLHQLVPYFIQFISEQITHNLNNIALLSTMLEVIYSLLSNTNIFLDPYIHVLMPCILTLLLAKHIGSDLEHFAVRDFAASLLEHVCKNYGKSYTTLRPRVTRTLLKAFLDANKPVGTLYGAIIGLKSLGEEVVRITILGNLKNWGMTILGGNLKQDEKELLVQTAVKTLKDLSGGANEGMQVDVTEEEKNKLINRVGDAVAEEILKEEDSKTIVDAIFFGALE
jgi:transcription initiation factor TFIID subunit 6